MNAGFDRAWDRFRGSGTWRLLRRSGVLRSALYFAIESRNAWREPGTCSRANVDAELARRRDPWSYETSPVEHERFRRQTLMIDAAANGARFRRVLEIGCAEGLYTEVLAKRCESLLVLDHSPTALERAKRRVNWPDAVRFELFDLRSEEIPGQFDLIVVAGVLEYFSRRRTLARVRSKLAAALAPGGCLLVTTTRANPVVEESSWSALLLRGRRINAFVASDPSLETVAQKIEAHFAFTMCRKRAGSRSAC